MDLTSARWNRCSAAKREELALRLGAQLPGGLKFEGLRSYGVGDRENETALFRSGGSTFVLIPGGIATIGHDADRGWEPNPDELSSWRETASEYDLPDSLVAYVPTVTTRSRRIEFPPLLVETSAIEPGWEPVGLDDPQVLTVLREVEAGRQVESWSGDDGVRVRKENDGVVIAERSRTRTFTEMVAEIEATGFRLPTSDEWEYLCGCGAQTLFRWGDHCPCDRYPTDISPAESEWRRKWVQSGGRLEYPREGFVSDWDHHLRPNAFGIFIASDPYQSEMVAEAGITRGGDGGGSICGGVGFFMAWLTLATFYFEDDICRHDPSEQIPPGSVVARRILELK